ncbi:MAG: subtype I-C CRISPR-associated endonuclease Cas1 [Oceanospirillaceae bacterium]|nr:subtype I-C CRISPR-associated endonuclease Cas1 [Oceanospirillaceae bacterium]MBT10823.1 subtype I-C CRISPR-associated endonuclease Cas1 [Oceanospirillaceae bacterium]|tara:strand:+ start:20011 stop:21027 length:1017 start_codon:yes stop_codon:yes gene_type:complete
MKKLLNTLYITRQETYLHKERETIVIKQGDQKLGQFPSLALSNILCFGRVSVSPFLMGYLAEQGIGLSFFTEYGRFLVRTQGPESGNVLLRRSQYRWADNKDKALSVARLMIAAKIANSRAALQRDVRNHGHKQELKETIEKLATSLRRSQYADSGNSLMGIEGDAANAYFSVLQHRIRAEGFQFNGRVRRPPTDAVNALLSFAYSMITQDCIAALQGVGLDPYVGFLHQDRPGRPGLALDLLEEFRAGWADRLVLTLINRQQLKVKDCVSEASGAVRLTDDGRKTFLTHYQDKKREELIHPYLQEKVPMGLLPHCQALLLARHIRGDMEYYTPWLVK